MTTYVSTFPAASGTTMETMSAVELRVISNLLQQDKGNMQQDELKILRNDQALEMGVTPPTVPGN